MSNNKEIRDHATEIKKRARQIVSLTEPEPPPGPVTKIPEELTYRECRKIVTNFLVVNLGISKLYKLEDIDWFAEECAKAKNNWIRFMSAAVYGRPTKDNFIMPYIKTPDRKFQLEITNSAHVATLRERKECFNKRRIFTAIEALDDCSTHAGPGHANGWWADHWMNRKNNVNDTRPYNNSIYHYYENLDKPDPQGRQCKNVKKFQEGYVHHIVEELDNPYTMWGICNEAKAGHQWHRIYQKILEEHGVPKWRILCSTNYKNWYKDKMLYTFMTCSIHGNGSLEEYKNNKRYMPANKPWLPSCDGREPLVGNNAVGLLEQIFNDKNMGLENNDRPMYHAGDKTFRLLDWDTARKLGEVLEDYEGSG